MPNTFRIHPAFGIARVGDADAAGFLGPQFPGVPANWNFVTSACDNFKVAGQIKRQGVCFRVFEFDSQGSLIGEVLPGQRNVAAIEWTVHLANRKAAFYRFSGPDGEDGDFSRNGVRNDKVGATARKQLEIDPGPKTISGLSTGPIPLMNPNPQTNETITDLGDLRTDAAGRLIVFGGHGRTLQLPGAPDIDNYVNNDGWFDDVGDGPVSAVIRLDDNTSTPAETAWVSVGPPDFAPTIGNVVSMFDTMWDVVVRDTNIPIPDLDMYRPGGTFADLKRQRDDWDGATNTFRSYRPSYKNEILPILFRALSATFVHNPPDLKKPFHNTLGFQVWADLGDPDPLKDVLREELFKRVRNPNGGARADSRQMPRGLGDEYCNDEEDPPPAPEALANPKRFFSLTRVQYALLARWAERQFEADGVELPSVPVDQPAVTPAGLDRSALESSVGGPFFPGIEVSWVIRNPKMYREPFRFQHGAMIGGGTPTVGIPDVTVSPGFLTQQMALPWQADFRDCKMEPLTNPATGEPTYAMWWAAQRPDHVFPEDTPDQQVPWTRQPHFKATDGQTARYKEMVARWPTLGFVAKPSADGKGWLETERNKV